MPFQGMVADTGLGDGIGTPAGARDRTRSAHAGSEAVIVQFALKGARHTSPGWQLWEPHPREEVCSEGTPHRVGRGRCPRHGDYAVFLQNAGLF
jgi:hypothetical protein